MRTSTVSNRLAALAAAAGIAAGLLAADQAPAQDTSPVVINYQGILKEGAQPYDDGTASVVVRIWDSASGGNPVSFPSGFTVPVDPGTGLFSVDAQFNPFFTNIPTFPFIQVREMFNGDPRWLEVSVNGETLSPRQPLRPAPVAAAIDRVRAAWQVDNNNTARSGPNVDRFGIGTADPQSAFDVRGQIRATDLAVTSGRLGVGTTAPAAALDVRGETRTNGLIVTSGNRIGVGTTTPQHPIDVVGRIRAGSVEITGGSDLAEPFDISGVVEPRPGMVVSIDPEQLGKLRVSDRARDSRVAGVISGANGVSPGLTLTQENTDADGALPVALTGRVWCYADADANGPVRAGDLLTTSATPGHAMKAGPDANGSIIGKAMSGLDAGRGMVLVLVNLQ